MSPIFLTRVTMHITSGFRENRGVKKPYVTNRRIIIRHKTLCSISVASFNRKPYVARVIVTIGLLPNENIEWIDELKTQNAEYFIFTLMEDKFVLPL